MQGNPIEEWQRLTEHYRGISNEELLGLAAEFADLTPTAQEALRGEMRTRGLGDPLAAKQSPPSTNRLTAPQLDPGGDFGLESDPSLHNHSDEENSSSHDYTWKTQLCECESTEQAWQIHQALLRAGVDSWVEQPGSRYAISHSYPRIMVAADQLERAVEIASQPIPKDIVDQFNTDSPEFEPPSCPKCGAGDPVLEGVDPVNSWHCEACGKEWADSTSDEDDSQEQS
jgi:hypothetical protein